MTVQNGPFKTLAIEPMEKHLVMGLGQTFFTQVGSGKVSHLWFGFGKFPEKFQFFSHWVNKNLFGSGSYLLQVKSKLGSGHGPSLKVSHEDFQPVRSHCYSLSVKVLI